MNALEAELHYPFADRLPEPGRKLAVAPGIWWMRVPLPFALDHVNLWLLRDCFNGRDGFTVIDCGIASETTQALWQQVIANELEGLPIVRILCTHTHPDHIGNASWLQRETMARMPGIPAPPLWMTLGEYAMGRVLQAGLPGTYGAEVVAHYRSHGLRDEAAIASMSERSGYFQKLVPEMPPTFRRISDGDLVEVGQEIWRVIAGFGHSPEHASLYGTRSGVLISGDMLLPRISTNVSVHAMEPEASPVQQFMDSLERFNPLPVETLVLPSHGKPFLRMHRRIEQLREHHDARLEEVLTACLVPQTAADIVPVMFRRPLDHHQLFFAFGEALAHLNALWYHGLVSRRTDDAGVYRFAQI